MSCEFSPQSFPDLAGLNPYWVAEAVFIARLEALQEMGLLRRPSEITDEYEQDDHFDDLMRLYRQACWELGLAWPPPPLDDEDDAEIRQCIRVVRPDDWVRLCQRDINPSPTRCQPICPNETFTLEPVQPEPLVLTAQDLDLLQLLYRLRSYGSSSKPTEGNYCALTVSSRY